MRLDQKLGLLVLAATAMVWAGCSDDNADPKSCPDSCDPGYSCNTATGVCDKDSEVPECAPNSDNSCKSEVYYCAKATKKCVRCDDGKYNCDGDTNTMCEESQACSIGDTCDPKVRNSCGENDEVYCDADVCTECEDGKFNCDGLDTCTDDQKCGALSNCDPDQAFDCPSETFQRYCDDASKKCKTCPTGKYSCDGKGDCDDDTCEVIGTCDVSVDDSCDTALEFCENQDCSKCPTGTYNCNGDNTDGCENDTDCFDANGCIVECVAFLDWECSRRASGGCQECNTTEDCTKNPRTKGPICDTSDLAGTGFNFCICVSDADCVDNTHGKVCKTGVGVPNPKLKQCACDTSEDCPSSHPLCVGETYPHCEKKCTSNDDCRMAGAYGTCDTTTGECYYSEY